ncbi:hypothetical protein [Novosphingobium sp.]|uniref:hypothetical protein n=1 Tax=Novosphingobium sp. TaxID=1874826 RepID=UPI00260FDF4F|nr:hypothetical protein [Novosphingobium sp.]
MGQRFNNRVELKGGEIILFNREGAKKPIWHMRIHIRGMRDIDGKTFSHVQETTGELDLDEAKRIALDRYEDLKLRTKHKQPAKSITFAAYYERWWTEREQQLRETWKNKGRTGKNARITWYMMQSKRYWLPYFGQHKFEDMTQSLVLGYWKWRMLYWSTRDEKERRRFGNHALTPSKKTLDMEQAALREVFKEALSEQLTSFQPVIEHPFSRKGIPAKRRPSLDPAELKTLHEYMDLWVRGEGKNDKIPGARINSRHLYQRKLLQLYLQWIEGTGMRTGEVLLLKHADIGRAFTELYEARILKISVSSQTKTGARTVISNPAVVSTYVELQKLTGHTKPEDWLFCNPDGKKCTGFFKTLPQMLEEAGVAKDAHGDKRTAYSFRHVYAEGRFAAIGFNPIALDLIATNMGTGRQSLENHYIRRGIITDPDALIANHGLQYAWDGLKGQEEGEAKRKEIERREKRGF